MSALSRRNQRLEFPVCRRKVEFANCRFGPGEVGHERQLWSNEPAAIPSSGFCNEISVVGWERSCKPCSFRAGTHRKLPATNGR